MSLLRPPTCRLPIRAAQRNFSTSTTRSASLQIDRNDPEAVADTVPAYPHGPARWYKQSNKGLYGCQRIQFGNNVSGDFNTKTRRTFQVNVLSKRLWSHALDRFIQVRVTSRTLRTIDRVGGLDEYLLSDNASRIKQLGVSGWWLRWAIMQQPAVKARFEKERYELGLGPREDYESKLKALEESSIGADLEEAYAALPEEEEAPALEPAPEQPAEETRTLSMEGPGEMDASPSAEFALEVTNPPDLPPLKFRTDRRTHVVLTPNGWVRTQPYSPEYSKQCLARNKFPNYVEKRMAMFEDELRRMKRADGEMTDMRLAEEKEILRDAKRRFTKQLKALVDGMFEERRKRVEKDMVTRQRTAEVNAEKAKRLEGEVGSAPNAFDRAAAAAATA